MKTNYNNNFRYLKEHLQHLPLIFLKTENFLMSIFVHFRKYLINQSLDGEEDSIEKTEYYVDLLGVYLPELEVADGENTGKFSGKSFNFNIMIFLIEVTINLKKEVYHHCLNYFFFFIKS